MDDIKATLQELMQCLPCASDSVGNTDGSSSDHVSKFTEILQDLLNNEDDTLELEKITDRGIRGLQGNLKSNNKRTEKIKGISTTIVSEDKTLVQYIAEKDLSLYLPVLLNEGVNPNSVDESNSTHSNEKLPPILLAAKCGHASILEVFKRYNDDIEKIPAFSSVNELQRRSIHMISTGLSPCIPLQTLENDQSKQISKVPCDFSVLSEDGESILHLLLKTPVMKRLKTLRSGELSTVDEPVDSSLHDGKEETEKERREQKMKIRKKYECCLDLILSVGDSSKWLGEQIRFVKLTKLRHSRNFAVPLNHLNGS